MNVVSVFPDADLARQAIDRLQSIGFTWDAISSLARLPEDAQSTKTKLTGESSENAVPGSTRVALLSGPHVGSEIQVPGLGSVRISGPLVASLYSAGASKATGGLLGALVGVGVNEEEASDLLIHVQQGGVIVAVEVDSGQAARARKALSIPS